MFLFCSLISFDTPRVIGMKYIFKERLDLLTMRNCFIVVMRLR